MTSSVCISFLSFDRNMRIINIPNSFELFYKKSNAASMIVKGHRHSTTVLSNGEEWGL